MKKIISFAVVLLFALNVTAQDGHWEVGFSGGYGIANLRSGTWPFKANPIGSYSIGMSVQKHFNDRISLFSGLLFERKGNKITGTYTDSNAIPIVEFSSTLDKSYLVFPLMLRFHLTKNRNFFINCGPSFGFSIRDVEVLRVPNSDPIRSVYTNISRIVDINASIGVGYKKALNKKHIISGELRYNHGLLGITKSSNLKNYNALFILGITRAF